MTTYEATPYLAGGLETHGGDWETHYDDIPAGLGHVWDDEGNRWVQYEEDGKVLYTPSPRGPEGRVCTGDELLEEFGPVTDTAPDEWSEDREHHGDTCYGLPQFSQDSTGQWGAACDRYGCSFEVTGSESRREAAARFYGAEQPGLLGTTPVCPQCHRVHPPTILVITDETHPEEAFGRVGR